MNLPAHHLSDEEGSPILNISLNQDGSSFATATTEGWVVYGTYPLRILSKREFPNSSVRIVLPLANSNLLFIVGGPPSPLFPPNKVLFWDDKLGKTVAELEFREDVRGLAARRDRLIVALKRRIIIFVLGKGGVGIWREGVYETTDNMNGLIALATDEGSTLLAFPGRQPGHVQIVRLPPLVSVQTPLPPPPSHDPTTSPFPSVSILLAHDSPLAALTTTTSGSLIATASKKGTLIRIWDPVSSQKCREVRRGTDSAEIFAIAFRKDGKALCVSSDKGTIHVWNLSSSAETKDEERRRRSGGGGGGGGSGGGGAAGGGAAGLASQASNKSNNNDSPPPKFDLFKPYLPKYFSSEWSGSQFRLPPPSSTNPPRSRFSLSSTSGSKNYNSSTKHPLTVEDDVCVCVWIEVDQTQGGNAETSFGSTTGSSQPHHEQRPMNEKYKEERGPGRKGKERENTRVGQGLPPQREREREREGKTTFAQERDTSRSSATHYQPKSNRNNPNMYQGYNPLVSAPPNVKDSQVLAITHSGGWFRIALGPGFNRTHHHHHETISGGGKTTRSGSVRQNKQGLGDGATDGSGLRSSPVGANTPSQFGISRDAMIDCSLEEYRRFGSKDGW